MSAQQPMALEYHGKAQTEGHWRRGQHLIDALAYIDPLTPDVKQQVDSLIEEEMRRSTKRPADYLKELPPMPPVKFEGHPMLLQEYDRVRAGQPMPALDVTRYGLNPPPQNKRNDFQAWLAAADNASAQLEHQLNRITNLELQLKFGANAWRAQTALDEALCRQLEATLQGLRKQIDALNRERKLQQSAAGGELRVLEDAYYRALRKNLEISAACQAVEEEMGLLECRIDRITQRQQQQGQGNGAGAENGAAAVAGGEDNANGVTPAEQQQQQQQQAEGAAAEGAQQQEQQADGSGPDATQKELS